MDAHRQKGAVRSLHSSTTINRTLGSIKNTPKRRTPLNMVNSSTNLSQPVQRSQSNREPVEQTSFQRVPAQNFKILPEHAKPAASVQRSFSSASMPARSPQGSRLVELVPIAYKDQLGRTYYVVDGPSNSLSAEHQTKPHLHTKPLGVITANHRSVSHENMNGSRSQPHKGQPQGQHNHQRQQQQQQQQQKYPQQQLKQQQQQQQKQQQRNKGQKDPGVWSISRTVSEPTHGRDYYRQYVASAIAPAISERYSEEESDTAGTNSIMRNGNRSAIQMRWTPSMNAEKKKVTVSSHAVVHNADDEEDRGEFIAAKTVVPTKLANGRDPSMYTDRYSGLPLSGSSILHRERYPTNERQLAMANGM